MRFIQTLYIDNNKDIFKDNFGWLRPEYHLMSWALSCLQLKSLYSEIELYANSTAKHVLIDILNLPYTKTCTSIDNLKLPDNRLWALPKIYTYSLQSSPFLHIDGDVFLFKKFDKKLLSGKLIAQNIENFTNYYKDTQNEIMNSFTYFPRCVNNDFVFNKHLKAVNAGILGGNNFLFFKEYTKQAFDYIELNKEHFKKFDVNKFNVFFEQHLFYVLAKSRNIDINFLFTTQFDDNGYKGLGDFHEVPFNVTYLHLLGHYKKNEFTCLQMANKLRYLYPQYYYKIINLFNRKKNKIYTVFYSNSININDYKFKDEESLRDYKLNILSSYTNEKEIANTKDNLVHEIKKIENEFNKYINLEKDIKIINIAKKDLYIYFERLKKTLFSFLKKYSLFFINGRDLASNEWYEYLFSDNKTFKEKKIVICDMIEIVKSQFDWGRLFQRYNNSGIEYYDSFELIQDKFFSVIVNEVTNLHFTIYDLDEFEKIILDKVIKPISIEQLFIEMKDFANKDILDNYLQEYENLIITFIKRLVLIKAIRPYIDISDER